MPNTFATAVPVTLPTVLSGDINSTEDKDFFKFTTSTAGSFNATLSGLTTDVDLRLYDATEYQLVSSMAGGTVDENITYELAGGATYYVAVDLWSGMSSPYQLSMSYTGSTTPTVTIDDPMGVLPPEDPYYDDPYYDDPYDGPGGYVPPEEPAPEPTDPTPGGETVVDQDIAFVIDNTGSMGDDIAQVQAAALDILNRVMEGGGRVAVVTYNDPETATVLEFTDDIAAATAAINGLTVYGGGDWPEMVCAGLDRALDLAWDPLAAASKIVLFGDAPPKDGPCDAIISGAVAQNVEVHGVAIGGDTETIDAFTTIANGTGGSLWNPADASEVVETIFEVIEEPPTDPVGPTPDPGAGLTVDDLSENFLALSYLMVGTAPESDSPIFDVVAEGGSVRDAAQDMLSYGDFLSQFGFTSNLESKINVITTINMGLGSGSDAHTAANAYFLTNLTGGVSANVVFERAVTYLMNDAVRDPMFDGAAAALRGEGASIISLEEDVVGTDCGCPFDDGLMVA